MFRKLTKHNNTEEKKCENEIKRLTKERNDFATKYKNANKYKDEYETLCIQYKNKLKELEKMKKDTDKLYQELSLMAKNLDKKNK